jgi:DNA-binding XRE family transcriptional regulator
MDLNPRVRRLSGGQPLVNYTTTFSVMCMRYTCRQLGTGELCIALTRLVLFSYSEMSESVVPKTGFYRKLAEQVRDRREALGLTQAELAERAVMSRSSVANLETGRQAILLHQFVGLAKALELPWTELMPDIDEPAAADVRTLPKAVEAFVAAVKPRNGTGKPKR